MITPYPLQKEMALFHLNHDASYNLSRCGCGKTVIGGAVLQETEGASFFVSRKISGLQLVGVLREVCTDHDVVLFRGTELPKELPQRTIYVTHYENLLRMKGRNLDIDAVVYDECHLIKNRNAKRRKAAKRLFNRAERKLFMSATPTHKNWEVAGERLPDPLEMWSTLNLGYPNDFNQYSRWYAGMMTKEENFFGFQDITGIREEMQPYWSDLMQMLSVQKTKRDMRADLPPLTNVVVTLDSSPFAAEYNRFVKRLDEEVVLETRYGEQFILSHMAELMALRRFISTPDYYGAGSNPKREWLLNWIEDNPQESFIVYTLFRETRERIADWIEERHGFRPVILDKDFDGNFEDHQFYISTIAMAAGSFNLTHIKNAIFYEPDWSTINVSQARDRIDRVNQEDPKTAYYLIAEGTFDEVIIGALQNNFSTRDFEEATRQYFINGNRIDFELTF